MTWQELESHVRKIASFKWDKTGSAKVINGVKCDCVLEFKSDYWIIIEITQESTLSKLRTDLAKFDSVKPYLLSQGIYCECYFVCENAPPPSLVETGAGRNVTVQGLQEFDKLFFDYEKYANARLEKSFGSAVDPFSGEQDKHKYVPVKYLGTEKEYTITEIAQALRGGNKIILLGNYGTGKSRCIKELFMLLSSMSKESAFYPLAVNLRENWGVVRGSEIIQRHFTDLGLADDAGKVLRMLGKSSVCFLFDGFDEIGSQSWSSDPTQLAAIRKKSMAGVADLISQCPGGIIISGREHYFNSEEEMLLALGISASSVTIIHCADEFNETEVQDYARMIDPKIVFPPWLPRRPLVIQVVSEMAPDQLKRIAAEAITESTFWYIFITAICERESFIRSALDAAAIKTLLMLLARTSRSKTSNTGPISLGEIAKAFEHVSGRPPTEDSAILIQRLPAMGRISAEDSDRYFVDMYILDGLRAEDIMRVAEGGDETEKNRIADEKWLNSLKKFGLNLLIDALGKAPLNVAPNYNRLMRLASERNNGTLAADLALAYLATNDEIDFKDIVLRDVTIDILDLSSKRVGNLRVENCFIETLDISDTVVNHVQIEDCIISKIIGIPNERGLPSWITKYTISNYDSIQTTSRIRRLSLSPEHRILVTMIQKLFFQPGQGRKEEALMRGLGTEGDKKIGAKVISLLLQEDLVTRFKGKDGLVYAPQRKHTARMGRILDELALSKDRIWIALKRS